MVKTLHLSHFAPSIIPRSGLGKDFTQKRLTFRNIKKTESPEIVLKPCDYCLRRYKHLKFYRKKCHHRGIFWKENVPKVIYDR